MVFREKNKAREAPKAGVCQGRLAYLVLRHSHSCLRESLNSSTDYKDFAKKAISSGAHSLSLSLPHVLLLVFIEMRLSLLFLYAFVGTAQAVKQKMSDNEQAMFFDSGSCHSPRVNADIFRARQTQ